MATLKHVYREVLIPHHKFFTTILADVKNKAFFACEKPTLQDWLTSQEIIHFNVHVYPFEPIRDDETSYGEEHDIAKIPKWDIFVEAIVTKAPPAVLSYDYDETDKTVMFFQQDGTLKEIYDNFLVPLDIDLPEII